MIAAAKQYGVITLFPEMFDALADFGVTRRGLDQIAVGEIGHPFRIGREEHIGRCARFDLAGEKRRRRKGKLDLRAAGRSERRADVLQRVGQ